MRPGSIVYALFCLGLIALVTLAAARRYSPFADAGPRIYASGGGARGPTHK